MPSSQIAFILLFQTCLKPQIHKKHKEKQKEKKKNVVCMIIFQFTHQMPKF